jgi:hypothetical protein
MPYTIHAYLSQVRFSVVDAFIGKTTSAGIEKMYQRWQKIKLKK